MIDGDADLTGFEASTLLMAWEREKVAKFIQILKKYNMGEHYASVIISLWLYYG